MNTFLKSFLLLFVLCAISCSDKEEPIVAMECPDDALYTIDDAKGSMVYIPCYDAWGVLLDESLHDDAQTIGASLEVAEEYKVEGLRVQLDACYYEFDLPLILPDPAPWGYLYRMDNFRIIEEE